MPGHHDQEEHPTNVDDGTSARASARAPIGVTYSLEEGISVELQDAPRVCVPTTLTTISLAEMRVLAWLRENAAEIAGAERRWNIDRRAIAGVIAWEALKNVKGTNWRARGPGKAHLWDFQFSWSPGPSFKTYDTLVAQVEEAGALPKQDVPDREKLLQTPNGAISYIAAAMNLAATKADERGFASIRNRPDVLSYFWNSKDLKTWEEHLKSKKRGTDFVPETEMSIWVNTHLHLLEDGVGKSELAAQMKAPRRR